MVKGGRGDGAEMNSTSALSYTQRPKRPSATARTTMLRRWGPRQCQATLHFVNCCFNSCVDQSHKDSVRNVSVEEQLKQRIVQLSAKATLLIPTSKCSSFMCANNDCQGLGVLMCAQMSMHAIAHAGCMDTVRESALEVYCGRKIICYTGLEPA